MGDKAEAKQEGFFHQLRRIVSVEKEISKLQIEVLHGRSSDNLQDGTAVLLLRDIQDDLKQRKMAARHHLRRLCDDDGFLDMVPKCRAILKHQATVVQQLTEFIAQYGYLPKKNPAAGDEVGVEACVPATPIQNHGVGEEPQYRNSVPIAATPEKPDKDVPRVVDLDKTPTLEDFGISEERIAKHLGKAPCFKQPMSLAGSIQKCSSSDTVPDQFHHNGICVTPGFFDGRSIATITPQNAGMQADHRSKKATCKFGSDNVFNPKHTLWAGPEHVAAGSTFKGNTTSNMVQGNSMEDVNLESPVPPLMTTPGLKPLRKNKQTKQVTIHGLSTAVAAEILRSQDCVSSTENSPIPPTMTTPGVKQIMKHNLSASVAAHEGDSSTDNSPIPPVLNTPGLKQIGKNSMAATLTENGKMAGNFTEDNSPIPPVLNTPGVKQLHKGPCSGLSSTESSANPTPEIPVMMTPLLVSQAPPSRINDVTHRYQTSDTSGGSPVFPDQTTRINAAPFKVPTPPRLLSKQFDSDDDDIPEMPELTFNFSSLKNNPFPASQATTSSSNFTSGIGTEVKITSQDSLVTPVNGHDNYDGYDEELPPEPELTYKFNTYSTVSPPPMKEDVPSTNHNGAPVGNDHAHLPSVTDDIEYIGPSVAPVTEDEYKKQPDYIQRHLPLSLINSTVQNMNATLSCKVKEGRPVELEPKDIEVYVGQKASVMLLVMSRLGRLRTTKTGTGKPAYVVIK